MPKSCVAVNCSNHNLKEGESISFHVFPKCDERREKWIQSVKRQNEDGSKWVPSKHAVLCGKHFIQGRPNADPSHPDYIPSIFPHAPTDKSSSPKLRRYASAMRRKKTTAKETGEVVDEVTEEAVDLPELSLPCQKVLIDNIPMKAADEPVSDSERAMFQKEIQNLREERDGARTRIKELEDRVDQVKLSAACCTEDDKSSRFHTGLRWDVFLSTFQYLQEFIPSTVGQNVASMSDIDQFFVTLVKLRFGIPFQFIAQHTGHSNTTIIKVFWKWIDVMYAKLSFVINPPDHETSLGTLPPHFKSKFPRLTCIIDCFEIFIDQPLNLKARATTYSNYKKHTTVKFLIGCTSQGCVSFLSKAWGGRVSDIELVRQSGFIDPSRHRPGDQILADRGFTLQDEFVLTCGAFLIIPSFTKGKKQLSAQEVEVSRKIASVRIHIERIIGLIKNRYAILQGTLPINVIKSGKDENGDLEVASVDKIVTVCAILVNLGDGIVWKEQES